MSESASPVIVVTSEPGDVDSPEEADLIVITQEPPSREALLLFNRCRRTGKPEVLFAVAQGCRTYPELSTAVVWGPNAATVEMYTDNVTGDFSTKVFIQDGQVVSEPEPEVAAEDLIDLSVLDGSIAELEVALASGDHDGHLDELVAAEEDGKTRKGALAALAARREELLG